MLIDYEMLPKIMAWVILLFVIYFIFYRKYIYSVFDPVFFYVWTTAFSGVFVINVVQDQKYIYHYFVCQLFLFIGFWVAQKNSLFKSDERLKFNFYDRKLLAITIYILFFIYILANLFTLYSRGSAFFSDDPYAREINFEGGFGIFRRINWGIGSFLGAGITILYLIKPKRIFLVLLIILSFFTALEGAKSSLLRIVIIIASLIYHPFFKNKEIIVNNLKKYAPVGILAVALTFFIILSKESRGNNDIFISFIRRLLSGSDAVVFFYLPQNEYLLTAYKPLDFILYILNPILGFLHLVPYVEPFGSITVGNTQVSEFKTDIYLAPNTPFYIEGQIFFGYYGAFIYSFFIGVIFSFIRKIFMSVAHSSYFSLALMCAFFLHSGTILIETSLFIKFCLDTCLFSIPVYIVVCFINRQKLIVKKWKFIALNKQF